MKEHKQRSLWQQVWTQYLRSRAGVAALACVALFALIGLYAPLLASSRPVFVVYDGGIYFPLLRYLFYPGFFTKKLDIFYNVAMLLFPLWAVCYWRLTEWRREVTLGVVGLHVTVFLLVILFPPSDPASSPELNEQRQEVIQARVADNSLMRINDPLPEPLKWDFDLAYMTDYAKLNLVLRDWLWEQQDQSLKVYAEDYAVEEEQEWLAESLARKRMELVASGMKRDELPDTETLIAQVRAEADPDELTRRLSLPTLWHVQQENERQELQEHRKRLASLKEAYNAMILSYPQLYADFLEIQEDGSPEEIERVHAQLLAARQTIYRYREVQADLAYAKQRRAWLEAEKKKLGWVCMPLIRWFHWEDDAGGEQDLNRFVDWWNLTRINRKDLVAGLLFGVRISLVVGITAIALALLIGIPIGSMAGYYGGKTDIVVMRLIEIWESMPSFFMLLMVVAVTQSKSIFLVISVIGIFGWTGFSRFIRGEFLKQRHLPYVDACTSLGFNDARIIFRHILPNAIPPLLTLLPFAVMGAITSEAGLSFLGLGEEGSCSWGVLMDEGRTAFPGESYLLWPPAIMLTTLLVAIALVGDALRDALDPKMRST